MIRATIILFFTFLHSSFAQLNELIIKDAAEQIASVSEEPTEEVNPIEMENLLRKKVKINSGNYQELISLQLLTEIQAQAIIRHIERLGALIALEELQVIQELDRETIQRILPYIMINAPSAGGEPRREILIRNRRTLTGSKGNWFDRSSVLVKCRYDAGPNISLGLLADKDADERFEFTRKKWGLDHYSGYVMYKSGGFLRKLIAGDYRIQYGQGLMAWTGAAFTSNTITGILRAGNGISPSITMDENNYLRGIAASTGIKKWNCDLYLSSHSRDAIIYADSVEYFTSFQTTGLHRYDDELRKRKTLTDRLAGIALEYTSTKTKVGMNFNTRSFDRERRPNGDVYDRFDIHGKQWKNGGMNYRFIKNNMLFFGELAFSGDLQYATTHGVIISVTKKMSLATGYRNFSKGFHPVYGNPFATGSTGANERGVYLGMQYQLTPWLHGFSTLDRVQFPFLRYRADKPSAAFDFMQQIDYTPSKKMNIQFRFRQRSKQLNRTEELNSIQLIDNIQTSYRIYARFKVDEQWEYATRIDHVKNNSGQSGLAVSADIFYHPKTTKIKWNFRYAAFRCPDFEARIYQYENDLPGSFSIPFYYGNGNRCYMNVQYSTGRSSSVSVRYAVTNFSTGIRTSDLRIQMRWKL